MSNTEFDGKDFCRALSEFTTRVKVIITTLNLL